MSEPSYYDNADLWHPARYSGIEADRAALTIARMPPEARSVLDVGCGNGVVTDRIEAAGLVVGVDRSFEALRWVSAKRCLADVQSLPFADAAFDLVLATEVLEHLPIAAYKAGLREVTRVAARYVLLSVPWCEDLLAGQVVCPECQCRFHASYHVRRFTEADLQSLFDGVGPFAMVHAEAICPVRQFIGLGRLRRLLTRHAARFSGYAVCPQCGHRDPSMPVESRLAGSSPFAARLRAAAKRIWPKRSAPRWWLVLYEKR